MATRHDDTGGRGTLADPPNRFETMHVEREAGDDPTTPTEFYRDATRSILSENQSPDLPFRYSVNPYRGCEHGCIYCYARPTHEYLGFSAGLDFERRIMVKHDAPRLLRRALARPSWTPQAIAFSGNTDCYQPAERHLELTRGCLRVCADARNPVSLITKSALVARDADVLFELADAGAAHVNVSIATVDDELAAQLEPRAASPQKRIATIERLATAGIPVSVLVGPVIPGLTDTEISRVLDAAAGAGARSASWVLLRLPGAVEALFEAWLRRYRPDRADHVLGRIRDTRAGSLSDARFGRRQRGTGEYADQIAQLFLASTRRAGLDRPLPPLETAAFRRPDPSGQLSLL